MAKACKICQSEISEGAIKCLHCGSYQDFRRHLDLGNTTLALAIAFLGLLTTVPNTISLLINQYHVATTPAKSVRIVSINPDNATIAVENSSRSDYIVESLQCFLYFPRDARVAFAREGRSVSTLRDVDWTPRHNEALNPIVVVFASDPTILQSGNSGVFNLAYRHAMIAVRPERGTNEARSVCAISLSLAVRVGDVALLEVEPGFYIDFDLRALVEKADILTTAETTSEEIISTLVNWD